MEVITEQERTAHMPPCGTLATWATPLDSASADLCGDGVVFTGEARSRTEGGDNIYSSFGWRPVAL